MTDQGPIEARHVARILRRASELERADELPDETGTISADSLIAAAEEVGLSVDAVRRSVALERLGPLPVPHLGDRIVGPSKVCADAEVNVPADAALVRIDSWLVVGHHLRRDVLRSGHGQWSKRSGLVGVTVRTVRSWTGEGKLGDFERITAVARDSASESSMVRLTIDRATNRRWSGGGGIAIALGALTGVVVAAMVATLLLRLAPDRDV